MGTVPARAGERSVRGFAAGLLEGREPMAAGRSRGSGGWTAGGWAFLELDWSIAVAKSSPTRPKWVAV